MSRFCHQTCGLSTSAGNLFFFFAVCNNRPVRVIGRAGKRPEIMIAAANNLCHLRPWQWRPAQKSKLDWLPLLRVLLAKYDRVWEKNWNSGIPGAWYGGQVLYRRPNFSEFRPLEMINFWRVIFPSPRRILKLFEKLSRAWWGEGVLHA